MNENRLVELLKGVRRGQLPVKKAVDLLKDLPYGELGIAKIDHHRELRQGYPEVVLCQGKTHGQVREILGYLIRERTHNVLATRAEADLFAAVSDLHPNLHYNALGRTIMLQREPPETLEGTLAIITAGTGDLPVAEEAYETACLFGVRIERVNDVGVAGIHRLVSQLPVLRRARVLIVIAGMEGALASVVAGLVDRPVIAVPTSVGYGASFGGLAALLTMLNSCAGGVGVVNIDNGYGAACLAGSILRA
ncbi:nickel pincer cofactor biosynthesis protein LarB [Candidatus Thiosymbion oneisti]|uniref:nickel pincer cofactor biosynthesis protein LarB n=1 Tax=Candidatus Thiosymbion oneisti TaxID=589554 RepID=UPI000A61E441|nr:nickel pincer cofactor biosynthesis protein LarB [Candidatus Thiosymbion oneisti]